MLHLLPKIFAAIGALLGAMSCYYTVYAIVGLFATRRFAPARRQHRYAIVIAARNEEAVIGRLLESIRLQDYPSELLTVFVVADNCTDGTAQAARSGGAVCYERCDPDHRTKGYALEYLFSCIARDYGTDAFEGYFVFDADNLLNRDYVSRMNEAFDAGERIVTSCRASKNFGDNWISASYALHWLRTVRMEHRARSVFGLATRIQGTGFLFASELVKNGWHYTSLTEDRAFTADAVAAGYPISYCDAAVFYDEQPVSLRIALRQRIRWPRATCRPLPRRAGRCGSMCSRRTTPRRPSCPTTCSCSSAPARCGASSPTPPGCCAPLRCGCSQRRASAWSARRCWRGPPASESAGCGMRSSHSMSS